MHIPFKTPIFAYFFLLWSESAPLAQNLLWFHHRRKGWKMEDERSITWNTLKNHISYQNLRISVETWFGFVMFCGNCLEDPFPSPLRFVCSFRRLSSTARTGEVQCPTALRSCCFVDHLTGPEAWTWVQTWCPQRYGSTWFRADGLQLVHATELRVQFLLI